MCIKIISIAPRLTLKMQFSYRKAGRNPFFLLVNVWCLLPVWIWILVCNVNNNKDNLMIHFIETFCLE